MKQGSKKGRLVLVGAILALAGTGIYLKVAGHKGRGFAYQTVKVSRGTVKATILSTGVVAPQNRLDLKPPVAGWIEKVLVQEGQHVKPGQILAWMSSTERAALIDTARAKGPEEMKYWEESYKMTPILAPGRGVIILKSSDAGQTVTQSDAILSMSDHLIVKANVDETDLAQIKNGQRVHLLLDAFPNNPIGAKVAHIGYDAKTVNNVTTYEVDIQADEIPAFMKSGMTANVTFQIAKKSEILLVPAASIHRDRQKSYVLVPNPENPDEPAQKEVQVGISDGKKTEIISGIEEGETILNAAVRSLAQKGDRPANNSPFGGFPGGGRH